METTVAKNGAVRDKKTGRIVAMPALDRATAQEMQKAKVAKMHEVNMRALQRVVEDKKLIKDFGEYAWMAEETINAHRIATEPTAGKAAILARESNLKHTGHVPDKAHDAQSQMPDVIQSAMLGLLGAVMDKVSLDIMSVTPNDTQVVDADTDEGQG